MIHTARLLLDRYATISCLRDIRCTPGMRIARGFADIGYEEFCMLPNSTLLSLYLGTSKPWQDDERSHFFYVPDVEGILQLLAAEGVYVDTIQSDEGRDYQCTMTHEDGSALCGLGDTLLEACLHCLELFDEQKHVS